jgi:hypothetical protein
MGRPERLTAFKGALSHYQISCVCSLFSSRGHHVQRCPMLKEHLSKMHGGETKVDIEDLMRTLSTKEEKSGLLLCSSTCGLRWRKP